MSAKKHMQLTQKESPPVVHRCTCPKCGQTHIRKK
jgi:hypothetical protein